MEPILRRALESGSADDLQAVSQWWASGLYTRQVDPHVARTLVERGATLSDHAAAGIGLTVNTVTPGYIGTEMVAAMPEKVIEKVTSQIPIGRLGRPEEIARVVHFLAADASSYITGQIWGVNGGLDM